MVLEQTLLQSLAVGAEGLMLKFLDSRCAYQPSKRSDSWLKLKKDYCEGLRDSLDLVCFGYGGAGVLFGLFLISHPCRFRLGPGTATDGRLAGIRLSYWPAGIPSSSSSSQCAG